MDTKLVDAIGDIVEDQGTRKKIQRAETKERELL